MNVEKTITIYDLAEHFGVSAATISNALNNKGFVSEELKEKIITRANKIGYMPNAVARQLRTKKTNNIMLAVNHLRDHFYFDLIDAVKHEAEANGFNVFLSYTEDNIAKEIELIRNLKNNFADGLILISITLTEKHLSEIDLVNCPVVISGISNNWMDRAHQKFDYVGVDTMEGIYLSTRHLISQGHQKIGYIGLPFRGRDWDERYEGFLKAMQEADLPVNEKHVVLGGYNEAFGYEAGVYFSAMKELPTAICVSTDLIAIGLYKAFEHAKINIPNDINIIGMDNIDICSLVHPKLSSVSIAQSKIGKSAASLLIKRINGEKGNYQNVIFKPHLVVRESSVWEQKSR